VVWFAGFLALLVAGKGLLRAQLVWSIGGLLTVFYLVYAELFAIGALCLWCTAIHAIVVGLFLLSLWEVTSPSPT